MKRSARTATIFILFFFLFFNGVQVYLIFQRIAGAKAKFNTICTEMLLTTLFQYDKIKGADNTARPKNALISWSLNDMTVDRLDSQNLALGSPSSRLYAMRVDPVAIETIVGRPRPRSLNLALLDSLYGKALDSGKIHSRHRLDTFPVPFKPAANGDDMSTRIKKEWTKQRSKQYPYSTSPQRIFFYPGALVFAELTYDYDFLKQELLWPMLAFFFILLISNTALVFVYKTIRKQKKINELKTDFINNITHEMKTPITVASAGLDALGHHISPTEQTHFYLHTSKNQLYLLNEFVERIVDAAVRDDADLVLKKEKIDLQALFMDITGSHSILQGKAVNFRVNAAGPVFIEGDRLHLETAFHNIIDNAIKYSSKPVDITIDIAESNRESIIKIRDNGMGIPPQFIKNIFDKFFRVPQGDAQSIKGFGLGLYYVRNIITKHSGNISAQSKPRSGTEFIITLPKKI